MKEVVLYHCVYVDLWFVCRFTKCLMLTLLTHMYITE